MRALYIALIGFLLVACGSNSTPTTTTNTITIENFAFSPATLTVPPGTTVTVRNDDTATHTLTASGKAFDTGDIKPGVTRTFTAPGKPGTYTYICDIHQYMQGTLTVK